jgi:tetratricopeptide (TPR) repeat protein
MMETLLRTANAGAHRPDSNPDARPAALRFTRNLHSTGRCLRVQAAIFVGAVCFALPARGQTTVPAAGELVLRAELARLLRGGSPEEAIRHAQAALQRRPDDPGVRREYITLHLALARNWLGTNQYDACLTAVEAVLAVDPRNGAALALQEEIRTARARAGQASAEIEELLRLELFEAALDRLKDLKSLRPDLAHALAPRQQAAWLGAADDHYLARNFNEAFALYEQVLALAPDSPADVHSRWAVSLALALSESHLAEPMDSNVAGRLLARAIDVLRQTNEPLVGLVAGGLLAERSGELIDAGRTYAEALGTPWQLPPANRRREKIAELRQQAVQRVRDLYKATPTRRRDGLWAVALPNVWKQRQTPHFEISARSDVIAARVAEVLELHYPRLAAWLGVARTEAWDPRLAVRVHATQQDLRQSTGTQGITYAVSHTRLQGGRVVQRELQVFQADPWLLSATLPHELTHALLVEAWREATPPLAVDEGLALQAEPPARRLMYRRLLGGRAPEPGALLATVQLPAELERFYAQCDALTGWLLDRQGRRRAAATQPAPIPALLAAVRPHPTPDWWNSFGWKDRSEMEADWQAWFAARSDPPRMPLMILVEPAPEHRKDARP